MQEKNVVIQAIHSMPDLQLFPKWRDFLMKPIQQILAEHLLGVRCSAWCCEKYQIQSGTPVCT